MKNRCVVPGCTSVRGKGKGKTSLFATPADPELLKQWEQAIPDLARTLTRKDSICARHFEKHLLSERYYSEFGGNVLLDVKKVPRLRKGAVPTIFDSGNGAWMEDVDSLRLHEQSSRTVGLLPLVVDPQPISTTGSCIKQEVDTCSEELVCDIGGKCIGDCVGTSTLQNTEPNPHRQVGTCDGELDIRIRVESGRQLCSSTGTVCDAVLSLHNSNNVHSIQHGCLIKVEVEEQCMDVQNPGPVVSEKYIAEHQREVEQPEQNVKRDICLGMRGAWEAPIKSCIGNAYKELDFDCLQYDRCIPNRSDDAPAAVSTACAATPTVLPTGVIGATVLILNTAVNTTGVNPQTAVNDVCTVPQIVGTTLAKLVEHLVCHPEVVKLPLTWSYHKVRAPSGNRVVYCTVGVASNGTTPVITKFINVTDCRKGKALEVFVMNRSLEGVLGAAEQPTTIEGFAHMVELVDTIPICRGGPTRQKYPDVLPERAKLDCLDIWRHDKCQVYGTTQCSPCARLEGTLRSHSGRQKKRKECSKLRICLPPAQRSRLDVILKQRQYLYKRLCRLTKTKVKLPDS